MDLNEILVFARVVTKRQLHGSCGSTRHAEIDRESKVSELEERLNARLLQRTTRKLSLTDVGRTYYDYCARIVAEVRRRRSVR